MAELVHSGTYKRLFRYLACFVKIGEETFEQRLKEKLKARYCFHPALLQEEGCVRRYAHYVASGMVQAFYHDEARGEGTFRLFKAGEIALIEDSFMNQQPSRLTLQRNIKAHFESIGYVSNESFKKLGPSYMVEEFIEEYGSFPKPLEAKLVPSQ